MKDEKEKMIQATIQVARAVSPPASLGVVAFTELKMLTSTRRVVINRAHLIIETVRYNPVQDQPLTLLGRLWLGSGNLPKK